MKYHFKAAIVLICLSMAGCAGFWPFGKEEGFVKVQGTHFVLNGRTYYYAGTNMWYALYLGSSGSTGDRPRLLRELDSLHALGVDNLRILAGSEASGKPRRVTPAILKTLTDVDDSLLEGLDFVLSEMAKRKMKGVLYLTNYWEWSGGMARYISWADSVPEYDPETDGWGPYMNYSARFFHHGKANDFFRSYVKDLITRENSYTGRKYYEDRAIMSWQLANEPRPGTDSPIGFDNLPHFYRWIDQTAAFIKSLDTNHLVSTGNEGLAGSLQTEECYRTAHGSKNIDYMTIHVWPLNWGWFNPLEFERTLPIALDSATAYIKKHIHYARQLNKPLVIEEFGIGRDTGTFAPGMPTTARDRYYTAIFNLIYDSAKTGSPIAGSNFWGWGGEGRTHNPDYMWRAGDTFVGDPPQEQQGLNSIFNGDQSTLQIIKREAEKMRRLGNIEQMISIYKDQ